MSTRALVPSGRPPVAPRWTTQLILIRHAHVDTGAGEGRLCGWLDLPLSSHGIKQLDTFAEQRSTWRFDALYTSPLQRAHATARALCERNQLALQTEPDLREIHCGQLDGAWISDVRRNHPEVWLRNTSQADDEFGWPGGETYQQFRQRVVTVLTRIAAHHLDQRVAIVTHSGVITQVIGLLERRRAAEWEHHRATPFSGTYVSWSGATPYALLAFNRTEWWRESPPPVESPGPTP